MVDHSVAQLLLAAAEQDLLAAEALCGADGIKDGVIGFHVQQAIEKAIKSVLSHRMIPFRRTHDIAELLDLMTDAGLAAPPNVERLDEYNPYAIEARYGLVAPSGLDRARAIDDARSVLAWAHGCLSQVNDPP
jgi:HEPN domain-containing protein